MMHSILMGYIQKVMARSFVLVGQSEGVMESHSFFYVHGMFACVHKHLGHGLPLFLVHPGLVKG